MRTIVIGTGLTNECLGARHKFLSSRRSVGEREIGRLLGKARQAGEGLLPSFLRGCSSSEGVGVVLIGAEAGSTAAESVHDPGALITVLDDVRQGAVLLPGDGNVLPWKALLETVSSLTGATDVEDVTDVRFLVLGSHTETEILSVASFLRRTIGAREVAVCSHLVGSATLEAHLSTLRYTLPALGVRVLLDLEETASWTGLDAASFASFDARPCVIDPPETRDVLTDDQKTIIELLCLHWTRTSVRPIAGGFSGSLLLLANGWKGDARTEPMVLKIDTFEQMRRELDGYYQVKDFFGKQVPTFGYPVAKGDLLGVSMELAAMEGTPETLQDNFEVAEEESSVIRFTGRFEKALGLLSDKLYRNTLEPSAVVPYRVFGLHAERQLEWLEQNAELILGYLKEEGGEESHIGSEELSTMLKLIARNEDAVETEVCVEHGDLNLANVICDQADNIWFIDWTHSGVHPLELDFAKLENDVKFVISKNFDVEDLPRLRKFEEFLLTNRMPPDVDGLPESLKFAKWDLRFRKILASVRRIREACFSLKRHADDWLVYRIALLRYATHTLSFDRRRGRGECELPQLMYALQSVEHLVFILVADDYHLRIRAEKPAAYPARQRILIDSAPWAIACEEYDPPYYVDPMVLSNDRTVSPDGWADPEDWARIADLGDRPARRRDDHGRPLNPRGRTGIAGRGQLGMWGRNLAVAATVVRASTSGGLEILLGQQAEESQLEIPRSFVRPAESVEDCLGRTLETEAGWVGAPREGELCFGAYTYDSRQTDHAWVEARAFVLFDELGVFPETFAAGEGFDDMKWWPLEANTVNRVSAGSARFVREAVRHLSEGGKIEESIADALLAATG